MTFPQHASLISSSFFGFCYISPSSRYSVFPCILFMQYLFVCVFSHVIPFYPFSLCFVFFWPIFWGSERNRYICTGRQKIIVSKHKDMPLHSVSHVQSVPISVTFSLSARSLSFTLCLSLSHVHSGPFSLSHAHSVPYSLSVSLSSQSLFVCHVYSSLHTVHAIWVNIQDLSCVSVILEHKRLWGILAFNIACVLLTRLGWAPWRMLY